jgi:hypothetical protein
MSEQALSLIITIAIIALIFAWAPFLNFVCPPCGRALERLRPRKAQGQARQQDLSDINPIGRRVLKGE